MDKEDGTTHKDDKSVFHRCWEVYRAVSGLISVAIGGERIIIHAKKGTQRKILNLLQIVHELLQVVTYNL